MAYEYFQNRNLNAENAIQGGKQPNPRYDNNRYGGEAGGPTLKDKIFCFGNYERQSIGQSNPYFLCTPTAAGMTTLKGLGSVQRDQPWRLYQVHADLSHRRSTSRQ